MNCKKKKLKRKKYKIPAKKKKLAKHEVQKYI